MGVSLKTTAYSLMQYSGFHAQAHHGGTCPLIMAIGRTRIDAFVVWRDKGIRENLLSQIIDEPDFEWIMIDASHIKVHPHAAGAVGGNQAMSRTKGGLTQRYIWPWMRMVCRSDLLLQKAPELIALRLAH